MTLKRLTYAWGSDKFVGYDAEQVDALLHEAAELFRQFEWSFDDYWCPVCGGIKDLGHAPDCRLAALLRKLPE